MWKKILALVTGCLVGYWLFDDFNPNILKGKNVVITGGSSGIGEQMAYHYARMGANVLVTSRRANVLKKVIERCREEGHKDGMYFYHAADMANLTSTADVITAANSRLGGIDYLVLNHIIPIPLGLWEGTSQNFTLFDTVIDINFKAYVHLTSHALPHLEKSRGSIIVVSSLAGKIAQPFLSAYSSSKFALDGFFSGLRQEFLLKRCDISVTLCILGLIGTESAVTNLKNHGQDYLLSKVTPATPASAALAIIKGGARRQREVHFPYWEIRMMSLLKDWTPNAVEYINRMLYTFSS